MTEENREIRTQAGTFRLTEEAAGEEAPSPELQERLRRDMERSQEIAETAKRDAAAESERQRERQYAEALERHRQDRLTHYRLRGVPAKVFNEEIWPVLEWQFVAGEEDKVERERRERSSSVY
jgi:hypothetical protein